MSSGSVNKVILVGRLGLDPEIRYLPSGQPVANLRLATSDRRRDRDGQYIDKAEWHSVVLFDKQAEVAERYLRKGALIYCEGRLQTRKWIDKQGLDRYRTEIIVSQMTMLDSRGGGQSDDDKSFVPESKAQKSNEHDEHQIDEGEEIKLPAFDDDIPF